MKKMILDAITSNPLNVFITIVCVSLAYLYYRSASSSSSSSSSTSSPRGQQTRQTNHNSSNQLIDEDLQRVIAQIERQERNIIRQEQDNAYQQSLKADREKQLKREEERRKKEFEEKEARERAIKAELQKERLLKLKIDIPELLKAELNKTRNIDKSQTIDTNSQSNDIVKLVFKLPNGTRVQKDFRKNDEVKLLYWFVFSIDEAPLLFKMTTNFPKRDLPGRPPIPEDFGYVLPDIEPASKEPNCGQTLNEIGLNGSQILFVYDLEA